MQATTGAAAWGDNRFLRGSNAATASAAAPAPGAVRASTVRARIAALDAALDAPARRISAVRARVDTLRAHVAAYNDLLHPTSATAAALDAATAAAANSPEHPPASGGCEARGREWPAAAPNARADVHAADALPARLPPGPAEVTGTGPASLQPKPFARITEAAAEPFAPKPPPRRIGASIAIQANPAARV
ncbi:hypothetical protein HK405_000360 [Cladochytrium tenue]|nr:hypothetical protein HK405_000360 [Cladochytrium tenue]